MIPILGPNFGLFFGSSALDRFDVSDGLIKELYESGQKGRHMNNRY